MEWSKLLSTKRVRDLFEGPPTTKAGGELRTEFERDHGRALFSTPVRRLQDKAQVFPLDPHDAVRTRLTHSFEVSNVARDLARSAAQWMLKEKHITDPQEAYSIETIAATCGLIHDLGNPPFGHSGEEAISGWFKRKSDNDESFLDFAGAKEDQYSQDFLRFEGNAQTIRLVSKLQVLSDLHGLNFTCGTLSAACKYTAASHQTTQKGDKIHETTKPGYFASENELVAKLRAETGTQEKRNPITFLVEACDDIVYATVDLEDGHKKGVLSWDTFSEEIKKDCGAGILDMIMKLVEKTVGRGAKLLDTPGRHEANMQAFRTFAIGVLVPSVLEAFKKNYPQIITGDYHGELVTDCDASSLINSCKRIGREIVYCSKETLRLEVMGRGVIQDLMDFFWEAASQADGSSTPSGFAGKIYALISRNYRQVFTNSCQNKLNPLKYSQMQLMTDHICGMTDGYACSLHRQLKNG